ncbi:diguanylate cyclase [Rhodovulum sp. PH10]|uniref:EAL domain-containing protein n=1 Tax=Rhodovulum sp. PH10 TaxID=1187851 RepID=UPI00027C1E8E|nr:EAL domain-containing protein [Rhodovulum sp. PH10]EJW10403.1 diguanylate cyclase [Rhodovulum sp. PH10]
MLTKIRSLLTRDDDERDENGRPKVTLERALKRGWLEIWYQPKIDLSSRQIVGAEGLIRVRHPELGVLPPGAFLPGAGKEAMLEMTERVIASALRDWEDCALIGAPKIKLAVNVPADAFVQLPITRMIREDRPRSAEWPGLILEVTEDQVMHDLEVANEVAAELRRQNCGLAVDDFGAGYSSLARLRQLPFTELKIDRAYVIDCDTDKTNAGMLETIVELAKRFELKTVAEGIETPHESHKLQGLGCAVGQGYLFAKPMAKDDFFAKLERYTGKKRPERRAWNPFSAAPRLRTFP